MQYTVRTPFLRLFLRPFGHASLQLLPLEPAHLPSLLNFAWNLLLVGLVTFQRSLLTRAWLASDLADPRVVAALAEKPLFALIYRLSYGFLYQAAFTINQFYFYFINLPTRNIEQTSLVALLDALCPELFTCPKRSKRFFIKVFALLQAAYLLTMVQLVVMMAGRSMYLELAAAYLLFFALNLNANMPFYLTFYYKVGTLERLAEITRSYGQGEMDVRAVEQEVGRLATLNTVLGRLLSLPLLVALIPYLTEILIFVSCLWGVKNFAELNLYLVQFVWQAAYLAALEQKISKQIRGLSALIREKCEQKEGEKETHLRVPDKFQNVLRRRRGVSSLLGDGDKKSSMRANLTAAVALEDIYGRQLRLRLFDDLCTLNWPFLLRLLLLLLNLIALMVQTTPTMDTTKPQPLPSTAA
ncbi:hypothetical protein TYRP_008962 [Tyrophagus putrescentiae]|nr:hypothetical protein TYRP_008962 [Tyrophagus putrescentiae]